MQSHLNSGNMLVKHVSVGHQNIKGGPLLIIADNGGHCSTAEAAERGKLRDSVACFRTVNASALLGIALS